MGNNISHKRIAKNTIALYIRGIISVFIGLFTSRVVIDTLGVDNYGVYSVAGGFVAMFGFINTSMAGATSRFITYEMGLGNFEKTKNTFANALLVHICIAILIAIICEAIGVWFLNTQLNIPKESMTAANVIFQLSIFSACTSITQVPYSALLISHEKMGVYAYMEIMGVTLKLIIVYLLLVIPGNKLIVYSILTAIVSFLMTMTYRFYCLRKFKESHTGPKFNKTLLRPMLSFSGWDLYGNMTVTARNQGITYLLNIFFGVAINGASSIASVINGIITGFSKTIIIAFRPQIIKNFASKSYDNFQELITSASLMSSMLLIMMGIPLIVETPYIFGIWLGKVPEWVVVFSRITMITSILGQNTNPIAIGIHASGKIKGISFITGTCVLVTLPIIWFVLRLGGNPASSFIVSMIMAVVIFFVNVANLKHNVPEFKERLYLLKLLRIPAGAIPTTIACLAVHYLFNESFFRLILVCFTSVVLISSSSFLFILNQAEKNKIKDYIKEKKRNIFLH